MKGYKVSAVFKGDDRDVVVDKKFGKEKLSEVLSDLLENITNYEKEEIECSRLLIEEIK